MGFLDRFIPKKDAPTGTPSDVGAQPESAAGVSPDTPRPTSPINMDEATRMMNEAGKAVEESARSFVEAAKPLGEQLKPFGQSLMADVSNASRDLGGALRDLTNPSSAASASPPPTSGVGTPSPSVSPMPDAPPVQVSPDASSPYASAPTASSPPVPPSASPTADTPTPSSSAPQGSIPPEVATAYGATVPIEQVITPDVAIASVFAPPVGVPATTPGAKSDDALPLPDSFDPFATPASDVFDPFATSVEGSSAMTPDVTAGGAYFSETPTVISPVVPVPVVPPFENTPPPSDALDDEGNLEEYQEPLPSLAPPRLEAGASLSLLSGEGTPLKLIVTEVLTPRGEVNFYRANSGTRALLLLREAAQNSAASAQLERENAARRAIDSPQIPVPAAWSTQGERVYLADTTGDTEKTFASQLQENAPLADQISTLTQGAAALSALHRAGFVHGAIRPEAIVLGKPVRLSGFESLSPLGQKSASTTSFVGYGAPEIIAGEALDARTDVYSVGALLYRIVTGQGIPETGWDDSTFAPQILLPGAPQILLKTLGPPATRYNDMSGLHRDLVRLRARLRPLARHASTGETTIGLEWGRTTNQDAWGELRGHKQGEDGAVEWTAWVVSDGMGGMASGEVASQVAVSAVLREAATWGASFDGKMPLEADQAQIVKTWTREANRQAVDAMNDIGARGGCTLVCGLVVDRRLTLAHVGDCRAYLWRGDQLTQLTRDHSYVMSLVLQGEITKEQMRDHPDRSKITRSLGDRHIMPDYFVDGLEVEMKVSSLELQTGDVLLAFSDGVWEPVLEEEMNSILTSSSSLEDAAHQFVSAAMREGGPDNATVYLFQMTESTPIVVKASTGASGNA